MNPGARSLILTESQAACLVALRLRKESKTEIAIRAKLDLKKAAMALDALKQLGLARRGAMNRWHPTGRGRNCRFKATPDRIRRGSALPGPSARRLLDVLDRPMQGNELAERLGITRQRVRQLVVKLHAQGLVKFGDSERILEVVTRTKDKTILLSRDEARVLSAIPDAYATNATKIRLAVLLPEKSVQQILDRFVARHFVVAQDGFADRTIYQITAAGIEASATPPGRPLGACASATCRIRSRSRGALGYTRCTITADQRFEKCTRNTARFDKCSHAISKAEGISAKDQPTAGSALLIDRKGARRPDRNGTTTRRVMLGYGSFIGLSSDHMRSARRIGFAT
jgi:DNA-binding MarR family transcriptional regulator